MGVGVEQGRQVSGAQERVNALRTAAVTVIGHYLEVEAANGRLQEQLGAERQLALASGRRAEELSAQLAEARDVIRRLQVEPPGLAEVDEVATPGGGVTGVTASAGEPWARVRLGLCGGGVGSDGCGKVVVSGEKFDIYRYAWGADFPGDRSGSRLVFTHSVCNTAADRSKDGG